MWTLCVLFYVFKAFGSRNKWILSDPICSFDDTEKYEILFNLGIFNLLDFVLCPLFTNKTFKTFQSLLSSNNTEVFHHHQVCVHRQNLLLPISLEMWFISKGNGRDINTTMKLKMVYWHNIIAMFSLCFLIRLTLLRSSVWTERYFP